MKHIYFIFVLIAIFISYSQIVVGQHRNKSKDLVYVDENGLIRWSANNNEADFFGANYCLPSACDYRAAGYVTNDRKKMVDEDMLHFARMGWNALRLSFWGDYENTDTAGNLVNNDHLNIMDYVIAEAKKRGVYILLSPIVTYNSLWPDAMNNTSDVHGISTHFKKSELGTNPQAIAAQQNYLKQLLNHVNPYTNTALKDEPDIIFIEMINEPWHHSGDLTGSVNYINALVDAVTSTGCHKTLFHNYSQDFKMADAMQQSRIQGVTFAWYPTGLNSGNQLNGNYLPVVDHYSGEMLNLKIAKLARIVYEFDSPDYLTGYMYPAMTRSFREVGAQWASMFSYDMLQTAPYNLGWQTHCLNMMYTPTKAISAIIAAEAMKNIPRFKNYGNYPTNTSFENFKLDYSTNLGELNTADKFYYTNTTTDTPVNIKSLNKIVGYGSSPVVQYEGKGIYFFDKIKEGIWRLEIYPDALQIDDPFKMPNPGKLVFRSIRRKWRMDVNLPDLENNFLVLPLNDGNTYTTQASKGKFAIEPGVYILTSNKKFNIAELPATIGYVGMKEYVALPDQQLPLQVILQDDKGEYDASKSFTIKANVYDSVQPTSVTLFIKQEGSRRFIPVPMKNISGYEYDADISSQMAKPGYMDYCIVVKKGDSTYNFPSGIHTSPADWDYYTSTTWKATVVEPSTPLALIEPLKDVDKMGFTRIGDDIRFGIFKVLPSADNGNAAFRLSLPVGYGKKLDDYTISIPVTNKIDARKDDLQKAISITIHARGISQKEEAFITLVENDGTSWSKKIDVSQNWKDINIPVKDFEISKGVMLPEGYPGEWKYWFAPADGRGRPGDTLNMQNVNWVQLSMRPASTPSQQATEDSWIEISSANIQFNK